MEIREKVPLKDWAWWKIGGPADYFCLPETVEDVKEALAFAANQKIPVTVLGGGTNVLISDEGVEGLVIGMKKLNHLHAVEEQGRLQLTALAGTPKSELTKIFLKRKMVPALFLCGLPGDIGGGVVMNAGVAEKIAPREFVELVDWIEVCSPSGQLKKMNRDELTWKYRASAGWQPGVIVQVGLSWPLETDEDIPRKVKEATQNRVQRQPLNLPSCGSTFKNPDGHKAGALIEQTGLKGFQVGTAQVSTKHANFIVNLGGATASQVKQVIEHVRTQVKNKFAVELETEVKFLGRW